MFSPIAEVNLDALRHNFEIVRQYASHSKILAMLKANAYGHGLLRVAKVLNEADAFAVARLDEAIVLRQAGITQPIVVIMGFVKSYELQLLSQYHLQSVVHSDYQIDYLESASLAQPITVWLKLETGLSRLGFSAEGMQTAYQRLMACPQVKKPIHLMSHFVSAEVLTNPKTEQQLARFAAATRQLAGPKSIAKSAAIMTRPETHLDWIRPGIMLYGISPFPGEVGADRGLKPVMTVKSELISIKKINKGESVGYGETWRCDEDMPVGVVGFGYADGYPRHITPGVPVLIDGVRCPVIGRISMDMLMVDLRPCAQAKVGDEVILWGEGLPVEIIARYANTIPYTLLVGLRSRVQIREKSSFAPMSEQVIAVQAAR